MLPALQSSLAPDPQPLTIEWDFSHVPADTDPALRAYLQGPLADAIAGTLAAYVSVKYPAFSVGALLSSLTCCRCWGSLLGTHGPRSSLTHSRCWGSLMGTHCP